MQRRPEFSFPGSPSRGPDRGHPPRPPVNAVPPSAPEGEEEIRWLQASRQGSPDCYSSGTPSPPLWAHHQFRQHPASAGSSPSRAQAIAGYRREMLDLVRGLPESAYELSLRDIVEHHHHRPSSSSPSPAPSIPLPTPPPPPPPAAPAATADVHEPAKAVEEQAARRTKTKQRAAAVRRQRSRSMERSVSLDTGLLIRFFVPLSIGKKKVSPKPEDANNKKKKQGTKKKKKEEGVKQKQDEEWWTKSTSSTGSSSNGSFRNGGGNAGNSNPTAPVRSRSRKRNGCYAFFRVHKSKNGVSQN